MKTLLHLSLLLFLTGCNLIDERKKVELINTDFEFGRINVKKIKMIEGNIEGAQFYKPFSISLSEGYFPNNSDFDFAQPILFDRDTLNLNTSVSYFYTKNDSVVRLIEYSWNQDSDRKFFIDSLYSFNRRHISDILKDNGKEVLKDEGNWWQKKTIWENDSIYVFSFIFGYNKGQRTRVIIRQKN